MCHTQEFKNKKMKKYFWSPHIDPQVATKISFNSLNSLAKFDKKFNNILINVFGEWDEYKSDVIDQKKI